MLRRLLNLNGFLICFGCMAFALYAEYVMYLDPCKLCILQRVAMVGVGIVCLIAALHHPAAVGKKVYGVSQFLFAAMGAAIAGRHIWIQNLPADKVPECGPSLDYLIGAIGFADAIAEAFKGSGGCADVDWVFLGLTMPEWVLVVFIGLALQALFANFYLKK